MAVFYGINMARIRYLKPDFFKDEDIGRLPFEVRLFFAGLWGLADKAGRLEDRPLRLKVEIFPYDDVDPEKCLMMLSEPKVGSGQPFINRYSTDGQRYIEIVNWEKHQKPHHTEKESVIPPAPPYGEGQWSMEKGMGMEKQHGASTELRNGEGTVKQRLKACDASFDRIRIVWDSHAKKGFEFKEATRLSGMAALSRVLSMLDPVRTIEEVEDAIKNFWAACRLKKSRAIAMPFERFMAKLLEKPNGDRAGCVYWPGMFCLDNFRDGEVEESHEERIERMRKAGYDV